LERLGTRSNFGLGKIKSPVPSPAGTPVEDAVSAVIPDVNKTVELGIVDPERLAVIGS
jgi:hypothetical protein